MTEPDRNRLAEESSPYLLQHADNPVHWQPWDPAALAHARATGKPILLSIGYSACHWCHVMAHESFEDPQIAGVMNELFVNIKVDREERPDLDKIYQLAHAVLARRAGGWPLTVFLDPDDLLPFFAGTYFPAQPRHGMPAFPELLRQISDAYHQRRDDINKQGKALSEFFQTLQQHAPAADLPGALELQQQAREEALQQFDPRHGGFGRAPKFPHAALLNACLRQSRQAPETDARLQEVVHTSLHAMAEGGLFDHLGGGFYRYSTDDSWTIPHFEKMLYDNGPLLGLYSEAFAASGTRIYAAVAADTARWLMREMQSPEGGYFATLDADSEGQEGLFYLWTPKAVADALPEAERSLFTQVYGLNGPANFEDRWHLRLNEDPSAAAAQAGLHPAEAEARLDAARQRLLALREQRLRPGRDEKILAGWNGLAIRGMALAARHLQEPAFAESAGQALAFIRRELWHDGRLLAVHKDGRSRFPAYLDDYAFVLDGVLTLLQQRWDGQDLSFARALAEVLLTHFQDPEHGGFFFTADDHEALIHRPKPFTDESTPAGNGVAAQALLQLGFLLGESRYLDAAEACLRAAAHSMGQSPLHHASLLQALQWLQSPPEILILRGDATSLQNWTQRLARDYQPDRLVFAIPADAGDLPPALADKAPRGDCVAYRCQGFSCSPPLSELEELPGSPDT